MLGALIRQLYHNLILVGDAARDAPLRGPLYYQLRASVRAMTWFLLVSDLNAYDDDAVECARQLAVVGQRLVDGCRADGSAYPQQMQMVPVRVRGVHAPMALVPRASGRRAVVPGPFGALPIDLMVPVLYFTCGVVTINGRAIVADVQTAVRLRRYRSTSTRASPASPSSISSTRWGSRPLPRTRWSRARSTTRTRRRSP